MIMGLNSRALPKISSYIEHNPALQQKLYYELREGFYRDKLAWCLGNLIRRAAESKRSQTDHRRCAEDAVERRQQLISLLAPNGDSLFILSRLVQQYGD